MVSIPSPIDKWVKRRLTNGIDNLQLTSNGNIEYVPDAGTQTFFKMPVDTASDGEQQSAEFEIGGQVIARVQADGDGAGGTKNETFYVPVDLTVAGQSTELEDVATGKLVVENGGQVFVVDATTSPPTIDFKSNTVDDIDTINTNGGTLTVDGDLDVTGQINEGA
jgi:hypothetical protein